MYNVKKQSTNNQKQVTHLSQRDHTAGWVSYGRKWKTETGRQYFTDIIDLPSTTVTYNWPAKLSNLMGKTQIMAITLFKVIHGHRMGRKPVCDQNR